jgi:hypothetical protein
LKTFKSHRDNSVPCEAKRCFSITLFEKKLCLAIKNKDLTQITKDIEEYILVFGLYIAYFLQYIFYFQNYQKYYQKR